MQFALSWARRVIMINNSAEDALIKVDDKQQGHCPDCDQKVDDKGGKTELSNCQMLCKWHNEHKSDN